MNRLLIYIYMSALSLLTFTACQSDDVLFEDSLGQPQIAHGILDLTLSRGPLPAVMQRSVVEGLALQIVNPDGTLYQQYPAGSVPEKLELQADVLYTLRAYSENQATWESQSDGRGEACYYGETTVKVAADEIVHVTYEVPMTNYAVTLTLPESFYPTLFKSYTFTLTSGSRTVSLKEGEKAYFAAANPFIYRLRATNTDEKTSQHSPYEFTDVIAGKLYNIHYVYATNLTSGGVDIEITDNTEHSDFDINV